MLRHTLDLFVVAINVEYSLWAVTRAAPPLGSKEFRYYFDELFEITELPADDRINEVEIDVQILVDEHVPQSRHAGESFCQSFRNHLMRSEDLECVPVLIR